MRILFAAAAAATALAGGPHFDGIVLSPARPAPQFALRDQSGKLVRFSSLRGKTVLVTFLYTHCPDVCPLIASRLNSALLQLGPRAKDVRVVAVSTDPKGDTKASVTRFVKTHGLVRQFRYLTGTQKQLAPVWRKWGVAVLPGNNGVIAHSTLIFLVDSHGRERVVFDSTATTPQILHDLKLLSS